ncbi:MAG: shikimate kinase [Rhodobacteraceae bacterium]|nr:shikimate kinase [Paracoccaceae bacterium]
MGAGKSRIGRMLARRTGRRFFDLDDAIEGQYGQTIASIFSKDGEQVFRHLETRMLARMLRHPPAVIATGGGAFLAGINRRLIARTGVSIYLATRPCILWQRVARETHRPLIAGPDGQRRLRALSRCRHALYALATREIHVEGPERPVALAERICNELFSV